MVEMIIFAMGNAVVLLLAIGRILGKLAISEKQK